MITRTAFVLLILSGSMAAAAGRCPDGSLPESSIGVGTLHCLGGGIWSGIRMRRQQCRLCFNQFCLGSDRATPGFECGSRD